MLNRRQALVTSTGTGAMLLSGCAAVHTDERRPTRTFVLVHGAWHGGWCWKYVRTILESRGHRVYTPTLTGLAERSHLLSTGLTLDTHIADVANLFLWEDLQDVVLVAHSYGGWPVSGALEHIGSRVRSVVFVDAFVPEDGQRVIDTNAQRFQQALIDALAKGEAGRPVPPASSFAIIEKSNADWVQAKMTPQPASVAVQPIRLTGARERIARKAYVRAPRFENPRFDGYLARAKGDLNWRTWELSVETAGHDVMVDAPEVLSHILEEAA